MQPLHTLTPGLEHPSPLQVETVDRGGTFLGRLRVTGTGLDLGLALLQAGLAKLHPSFDASRVGGGRQLEDAQQQAQQQRLKASPALWVQRDLPGPSAAALHLCPCSR